MKYDKNWLDVIQTNLSNISEILFNSDLLKMDLTQVINRKENWRRLFPVKWTLFSGGLSHADNLTDGEQCLLAKLT